MLAKSGFTFGDAKPGEKRLLQFTIAGEDKVFVPAEAELDGNTVLVWSDKVASPRAVRYAWLPNVWPLGNLYNNDGLPASPFRTDSWELK